MTASDKRKMTARKTRPSYAHLLGILSLVLIITFIATNHQTAGTLTGNAQYEGFSLPGQEFSVDQQSLSFSDLQETKSITMSVNDDAVYKQAYLSIAGNNWQPITLQGDVLSGSWIAGQAQAQMSIRAQDMGFEGTPGETVENYVITYSCSRQECSQSTDESCWDCHSNQWQLQVFNATYDEGQQPPQTGTFIAVTASSYQDTDGEYHPPMHSMDGDATTRWSASGEQWITYSFQDAEGNSVERDVDEVRILFLESDTRTTTFKIETEKDGAWSTAVAQRESTILSSPGFESFTFSSRSAEAVRITGYGNSQNSYTSLQEVRIIGPEGIIGEAAQPCVPDDSCAAQTCTGETCTDSCGTTYEGTLQPDCPAGYNGEAPNGCGTCTAQDTCASLGYECGAVNGESCGTCASTETCIAGLCTTTTQTDECASAADCPQGDECQIATCSGTPKTCGLAASTSQSCVGTYTNEVYINPTASSGGTGTLASPLNTIPTIQSDTVYFLKAGTSIAVPEVKISDKHHVKITTYGGTERFKINANGGEKSKMFGVSGSDIIIENIEVDGNGELAPYLSMYSETNVYAQIHIDGVLINNCKFYDFWSGIRAFGTTSLTVQNSEIYDIGEDGAFISNCDDINFINNYIHDVNQGFFTQAEGTTAPGDGIQLEPVANWKVIGNTIDRSGTGNKFAFIANNQDRAGVKIFQDNTLIGPYDAGQGGAIMYITGSADSVDISGNVFIMSDPNNPVSGLWQTVDNADIHDNLFVNVGGNLISNGAQYNDNEYCGVETTLSPYRTWTGSNNVYIGSCPSEYLS